MLENRKKKIGAGVGVAAIAAAVFALSAGTYAGFSDSSSNDVTSNRAGTFDLVDSSSLVGNLTNLVPGFNGVVGSLLYTNNGSVPGTLNAVIGATGSDGGICDIPLVGGLPGQLQVVTNGLNGVVCPAFSLINNLVDNLGISFQVVQGTVGGALPTGTLSQLLAGDGDIDLALGTLQPGQSVKIDIVGTIANNVGNLIQGDVLNMSSDATLSQLP